MNQPVVMPAEQYEVVETGVTAIGPMLYVVSVNEMLVRTAREAAIPVSGLQSPSHWWWNDP